MAVYTVHFIPSGGGDPCANSTATFCTTVTGQGAETTPSTITQTLDGILGAIQDALMALNLVPNLSVVAPIPGTGPDGLPLLGIQGDLTYIPTTKQMWASLGLAASPTGAGGMSLGAFLDPLNRAPVIVPGVSTGFNIQPSPGFGIAGTASGNNGIASGSVGSKGVSINASYGICTQARR